MERNYVAHAMQCSFMQAQAEGRLAPMQHPSGSALHGAMLYICKGSHRYTIACVFCMELRPQDAQIQDRACAVGRSCTAL